MQIILLEKVVNLGDLGEIVKVKDGYARNFLLPRNKALRASEANKKRFEANRANIEAENAMKRDHAIEDSKAVEGKSVILIRQASNTGQLYGSVATRDLADLYLLVDKARGREVSTNALTHAYSGAEVNEIVGVQTKLRSDELDDFRRNQLTRGQHSPRITENT